AGVPGGASTLNVTEICRGTTTSAAGRLRSPSRSWKPAVPANCSPTAPDGGVTVYVAWKVPPGASDGVSVGEFGVTVQPAASGRCTPTAVTVPGPALLTVATTWLGTPATSS